MSTRWARVIAAAAVVLVVTGCGAVATPDVPSPGPAVAPLPAGVVDPATIPATASPVCATVPHDPRQSYRPFTGPATGPTLATIRKRGKLVVGVGQNLYGLSYRDPTDGAMTGFEVDIVREIAARLLGSPNDVEYVALNTEDWPHALEINTDGSLRDPNGPKVDMALGTMTMECQRWAPGAWAFSTEYLQVNQRLVVNRTSTVSSVHDLGGKRVCATTNSTNLAPIAHSTTTNGEPIHLVSAPANSDCIAMLAEGLVDASTTNDVTLAGFLAQDKSIKFADLAAPPISTFACAIGMRKNEIDLIRFVNGVLADIREDGRPDQTHSLWSQYYAQTLQVALQSSLGSSAAPIPKPPVPMYQDATGPQ